MEWGCGGEWGVGMWGVRYGVGSEVWSGDVVGSEVWSGE